VEGTDERREWRAHRGGGSTCGVGAEAARRCSETVGGGVLVGRCHRDHNLAPQGERGQGEGASNQRKEA
jgi:hypothetical protein